MSQIEKSVFVPVRRRDQVRNVVRSVLQQDLVEREEPHCDYSYFGSMCDGARLVVRQFTNGTLQIQGNSTELYNQLAERLGSLLADTNEAVKSESEMGLCSFPHIGSDEAGKGDYFGPLVVAALYVDSSQAAELQSLGVTDSKRISDPRCLELSRQIQERTGETLAVRSVPPREYNLLYGRYKKSGNNLNDLLAACHLQVIQKIVDCLPRSARPVSVLVDKFARDSLLLEQLRDREGLQSRVSISQLVRAEQDAAVAGASIVARGVFLTSLQALSAELSTPLPKGAGRPTIAAGRSIAASSGAEMLSNVAKLHFANTSKILGDQDS